MTATVGNRCGHDPRAPRLGLVATISERAHAFIRDAMARLRSIYDDRRMIPELGARRSERREAYVLLGQALVYSCDLATLRIGTPIRPGSPYLVGLTIENLMRDTGLSRSRLERAWGDFLRLGFGTSKQPRQKTEGQWIGFPAVRTLARRFFESLDMGLRLTLVRNQASKAAAKAKREAEDAAAAAAPPRVGLAVTLANAKRSASPPDAPPLSPEDVARQLEIWRARQRAGPPPDQPADTDPPDSAS